MRRRLLKWFYPVFTALGRIMKKGTGSFSSNKKAMEDFYSLHAELNNGSALDFSSLKGKKVLIVNTASDCGYTPQYKGLQELHEAMQGQLFIVGFPSNDFGEQEKGSDTEIEQFCSVNYGVNFPLCKKSTVIKTMVQHPVYQWLTDENKNGWNYTAPNWNFCKYLVDESGNLTHFFQSGVEPMGAEMQEAIYQKTV